ncbi:MAG: DUF6036 family nucleotidyltransferase [Elusimicrobiota bacterium]
MLNKEELNKALRLLGSKMDLNNAGHYELVVCGGASLIMEGFSMGVTKDVDVIGVAERTGDMQITVKELSELPDRLVSLAREVASDLGLPERWLNTDASGLVRLGLPQGFQKRMKTSKFSESLTVHFAGRYDLIHFKLYAAADSGPGRHVEDLLRLSPSVKEIKEASDWAMTHDVSDGFRRMLKDMLEKLGYGKIAERI